MDEHSKVPPVKVVRALDAVRRRIGKIHQKMVPADAAILEMMTGAWVARGIYTATELGIPDVLRTGPMSAHAIATKVGANTDAVARLLRMLVGKGVFAQSADGRYALTPMSDALRTDASTPLRGLVRWFGHPLHWEHWGQLPYSVRTGRPAVDELRGKPMFEYLDENPEFAAVFNDGMTSVSDMELGPILAAYDFSGFSTIVDVAGGHGRLLAAVLRRAPQSRGILFDMESVVADAPAVLEAAGVADRCTITSGSFFESVPAGGDAYMLKHIIHDWDDERASEILANVRKAILATGKLLLIESVVPDDDRDHFAKVLDLEMLVVATGKERTRAQYDELLRSADFRLRRIVESVGPTSVIEADPA
jgi:hypothetical protein